VLSATRSALPPHLRMSNEDFGDMDVEVGDPNPSQELLGGGDIPRSSARSGSGGGMFGIRHALVKIPFIGQYFDSTRSSGRGSDAPQIEMNDGERRGSFVSVGICVFISILALAILFIFWQSL
jgi:hypothetical protein